MALSNAERQARYRQKVKTGELSRIDAKIPHETAAKLNYLAGHWQCSKAEALGRLLMEAWEREGRPIPGYDGKGEPLPDNKPFQEQAQPSPQRPIEGNQPVPAPFPAGPSRGGSPTAC